MVGAPALSRFAKALAAVGDDELRARYDPAAMAAAKIYLANAFVRDGDNLWDYVVEHLDALREFVKTADAMDAGAVVWLS